MEKEYMLDFDRAIETYRARLKDAENISKQNKEDIEEFVDDYGEIKQLALPSKLKHLKTLMQLAAHLGKDFRVVINDRRAITRLLSKLSSLDISKNIVVFGEKRITKNNNKKKKYSEVISFFI